MQKCKAYLLIAGHIQKNEDDEVWNELTLYLRESGLSFLYESEWSSPSPLLRWDHSS